VSDEVGAMVFLFGAIILPIIGLIAFVIWAIFHERNHSKKMKEEGKEDSMSSKQLFTILLIVFALMALPKTIVTILSFFD
jgi:heme/copper-type cytochrome/quinol oxidase subunit 2